MYMYMYIYMYMYMGEIRGTKLDKTGGDPTIQGKSRRNNDLCKIKRGVSGLPDFPKFMGNPAAPKHHVLSYRNRCFDNLFLNPGFPPVLSNFVLLIPPMYMYMYM